MLQAGKPNNEKDEQSQSSNDGDDFSEGLPADIEQGREDAELHREQREATANAPASPPQNAEQLQLNENADNTNSRSHPRRPRRNTRASNSNGFQELNLQYSHHSVY